MSDRTRNALVAAAQNGIAVIVICLLALVFGWNFLGVTSAAWAFVAGAAATAVMFVVNWLLWPLERRHRAAFAQSNAKGADAANSRHEDV